MFSALALRARARYIACVKKASLAEAQIRLSSIVDDAEHRRRRTLILRHGKPAAAIVPVDVAIASRVRFSPQEIDRLLGSLGQVSPEASAVQELVSGRR